MNDGSCLRLKPEFPNHVWSYDFMLERTHDGRAFRILNVIDEFTCKSLAVKVKRHLGHEEAQECLTELFCERRVPVHLRSDNGPEFIANALREWLKKPSVKPLFIEPGSPWENSYVESFNGKMRDELLNGEIFYTLQEAQILIERWRKDYNHFRPHSSLGYRPPAPRAWLISPLGQPGLS
jgi:transposase InsO family protein